MSSNHVLLETIELTQSAASVTFDNIPQTGYTDLKIVVSNRTNDSAIGGQDFARFNGVTTGYSSRLIEANGASVNSQTYSDSRVSLNAGNTATTNTFANSEIYIPNYTSSNFKSYSVDSVTENNATTAYMHLKAVLWSNTAAISSIVISPDSAGTYAANSTFSLYGVAAVGTTPTVAPKATGGNIVANDGTYWYHAFLSSGTFTPQISLSCNVLVIAGGGAGGTRHGSGGGAGGLLAHTSQSLTNQNYNCLVGAGGTGVNGTSLYGAAANGTSGNNSQFASLTASVGGGRGGNGNQGPATGGSGGGGTGYVYHTGATGTSGQGNAGGTGSEYSGAGGGGAGAVGANSTPSGPGGNGGAGVSTYSSWGAATTLGQNVSGTYWFAGGGGGGSYFNAGSATSGGNGGGGGGTGANNNSTQAGSGIAGTGGGGGGSGGGSLGDGWSGNGGSGVVIIRYAM
jgi:hypothetical protein